jgi:hypothetical protein
MHVFNKFMCEKLFTSPVFDSKFVSKRVFKCFNYLNTLVKQQDTLFFKCNRRIFFYVRVYPNVRDDGANGYGELNTNI